MNKNALIIGLVIIILAAVAWYFFGGNNSAATSGSNLGSYAYVCDNGSEFTMTPSEDVSEVTLEAGAQGMFTGSIRLAKMGDAAHFETTSGQLIVFSGAGEEVQLTVASTTTVCNPKADQHNAPWNWGDAGEGGGAQQDVAIIVAESIVGKWQSTDDAKFVREFKANDVVIDWHDNKKVSEGLFVAFTKANAPEVPYPLEDDAVYIQMTETGSPANTLYFKLVKLTPEELEMIYMDRGGTLRFTYVK